VRLRWADPFLGGEKVTRESNTVEVLKLEARLSARFSVDCVLMTGSACTPAGMNWLDQGQMQ
jgi:hypothetical protein